MKQKLARYEMHKYWGKKPHQQLKELIDKYSNQGDVVLEPFAGYGVFSCEAYLNGRNVILNDLNPISNFINQALFLDDIDFNKLNREWNVIKEKFQNFNNQWFSFQIDGELVIANSVLRNQENKILKIKFYRGNRGVEREISERESMLFLDKESNFLIEDWYPKVELIENSRISAKKGYTVESLFTKRTLSCHAKLLSLIKKYSSGSEKLLLMLAFSANLANCSKLVPPIKSRGDMSQGAWMTGFYIGKNYIENNVLAYYENRLKKVIKGKQDFLNNHEKVVNNTYTITSSDVKKMSIDSNSIDYIFMDPPYGSAVPYFEQSIIWNAWLGFDVDYQNEIVISDSKKRNKDIDSFSSDIYLSLSEAYRVLKEKKYISLTFHSISGDEWNSILHACIKNNFILDDFVWLTQKSFTPRQINRKKTIKGDVLVTLKKETEIGDLIELEQYEFDKLIYQFIHNKLVSDCLSINEIYLETIRYILEKRYISKEFKLLDILEDNFLFIDGLWRLNNDEK